MKQNVLVIGSGGREHAICHSLSKSHFVHNIFLLNGNGGTQGFADKVKNVLNICDDEHEKILNFINLNNIFLTIVGPEAPLSSGIVNFLEENNKYVFGPRKEAAILESSKIFMKDVLVKAGVATAKFRTFEETDLQDAMNFIDEFTGSNIVIKADGLAAGKGVVIAQGKEDAKNTVAEFLNGKFGEASKKIVIEEFIDGKEVSLFAITDGEKVINFGTACDYKRIFDNDIGLNTGGMGTFSPSFLTQREEQKFVETLVKPVVLELKKRNIKYKGVLFAGLMMQDGVAKVLEFNCRFGDPETQSILTRFEGDFYELCLKVAKGELASYKPKFSKLNAVSVVLASKGYPESSSKGDKIYLPKITKKNEFIFHAGTLKESDTLYTNGGRVLAVTCLGKTKKEARSKAYNIASLIKFDGMQYRNDIAEDLVLIDINFEQEEWKECGIGFYNLFNLLAKVTLKEQSKLKKHFNIDTSKLYEISVLLTDDSHIATLNNKYRDKNKPTNTLSFPVCQEYNEGKVLLGDIILSFETIKKEATEQEKDFKEYLSHLFVHSLLHLLGYDHEVEKDMVEMEDLEDLILEKSNL